MTEANSSKVVTNVFIINIQTFPKHLRMFTSDIYFHLANLRLFKFHKRNTRKRYELCSKLIIKTTERSQYQ